MKCRICEMEIPDGSNFCQVCGSRQTLTHCINCGHPVSQDAAYCPQCGIKIYKPAQAQPARKKRKRPGILVHFLLFVVVIILCLLVQQLITAL